MGIIWFCPQYFFLSENTKKKKKIATLIFDITKTVIKIKNPNHPIIFYTEYTTFLLGFFLMTCNKTDILVVIKYFIVLILLKKVEKYSSKMFLQQFVQTTILNSEL